MSRTRPLYVLAAAAAMFALAACTPTPDPVTTTQPVDAPAPGAEAVPLDLDDHDVEVIDGWADDVIPVDDFGVDGAIVTMVDDDQFAVSFSSDACAPITVQDFSIQQGQRYILTLQAASGGCDEHVTSIEFDMADEQSPTGPIFVSLYMDTTAGDANWLFGGAFGGAP